MSQPIRFAVAILLCLGLLVVSAHAGDYFVDAKHPKADDKNPGTLEAPFKTIQAALDKAQAGDSVEVRAGIYHEGVTFKRGGSVANSGGIWWNFNSVRWLTLEAYKDEPVVLDGSVTIPAEKWELVKDRKNTYCTPFAGERDISPNMVWCGEALVKKLLRDNPEAATHWGAPPIPFMPGDAPTDAGWFYDTAQKKLFVNFGGPVPGKDEAARVTQLSTGVDSAGQSCVRIRKLETRDFIDRGINVGGSHEFLVEDNYSHHCRVAIWSYPASVGVIRRNTLSDTSDCNMILSFARSTIVENNLFRRFSGGGAMVANCAVGLTLRNNVSVGDMATGSGIWTDCGGLGFGIVGNAFTGCDVPGCYIEAETEGAMLQWNTVFENREGICLRQNRGNSVIENYCFNNREEGIAITTCDAEGVGANSFFRNWVIDNGLGGRFEPDKNKLPANYFDGNVYKVPAGGHLFRYGEKQYKDLAAVRADIGMELHGSVVDKFDPSSLGLVTFRVADIKKSWKPLPMFGNPHGTRFNSLPKENGATSGFRYFWNPGTFMDTGPYRLSWSYGGGIEGLWAESVKPDSDESGRLYYITKSEAKNFPGVVRDGGGCLEAAAAPGKTMSSDGMAFWSVDLPTVDEAKIDLSLCVRANELKAAKDNGGLFVIAEFANSTGQNVVRRFLVGAENGQKPVGAEWMTGTYAYKQLKSTVTAPKGARWFRLGFGLKDCTGWTAFDEMDIQTQPGAPDIETNKVLPIDAKKFAWTPCDLTKLFNRPLADEVDNDGKGGWTDQGSQADLRSLLPGDYTFNHVAFRVEKGNACFIMKNKRRPSQNLPDGGKVDLKGKADVLAFLHSGGWLVPDVQHATYIIHYADDTKVEIPVIGGKNILDWAHPPNRADDLKYDPALGLLLPATTVASPEFVHVTVWMLLWKNPHPDKEIVALEVKGANEGIPGLIAVSRGTMKN
jgi:parallel beta-helix repeat protein